MMIGIKYDIDTINDKRETIKKIIFERSLNIKSADFQRISEKDLYLLHELYDQIFLCSWFENNFKGKLKFKLSRQLTRSAGNTRTKKNISELKPEEVEFEIKISLNHLANFNKADREQSVGGIKLGDKLESLMLVFEHELCHVIEFLIYNKSNCSGKNFKNLVYDLFGHVESTHRLVTMNEVNYKEFGFLPGDNVSFEYKERMLTGIITRINKRAIVMSPSQFGKYVDGKGQHYTKYYIPLNNLKKV